MKVGIGITGEADGQAAGRDLAREATRAVRDPGLILAFCSSPVEAAGFWTGLRSAVDAKVPIIGGSAVGLIGNDRLGYRGPISGALALEMHGVGVRVASADGVDLDEETAGATLASRLDTTIDDKLLLLFYDSVKESPHGASPPVMNASPPLIRGIERHLGASLPIVGAGLVGDYGFGATTQLTGFGTGRGTAVGAVLSGAITPYTAILHGCTPMDGVYHTITRMEGQVIFEVDGRSAAAVIDEQYGGQGWREQHPVLRLTLGVNHGERFGPYRESDYVNRLITGCLPDGEGIVIFEPDLTVGTEFQFMLRDGRTMLESAREGATALVEAIRRDRRTPAVALYVDCAGRAAELSETLVEEAAQVQEVMNDRGVPLFGFYSGVEIAPLLGASRGLDWTGVLLILAEG